MSRRQQASRVTIGTLIEAARKVKRPNLRQIRRNGEVPKGEMVELLAEAQGVPLEHIQSIGPMARESISQTLPAEWFEHLRVFGGGEVKGVNQILIEMFHVALMNPNCPSVVLEKATNQDTWRYVVRNPSLFFVIMGNPDFVWRLVEGAINDLPDFNNIQWWKYPKVVEWTWDAGKDEKENRKKAFIYAWLLNESCRQEDDVEELFDDRPESMDPDLAVIARSQHPFEDDDDYQFYLSSKPRPRYDYGSETTRSPWRQRATLPDVQRSTRTWRERTADRYELGSESSGAYGGRAHKGAIDWPAHARVINLILPYFEQIRDLKLLR
jgi:hypothetical protein